MNKTILVQPGKTLLNDNNVYAFYCVAFAYGKCFIPKIWVCVTRGLHSSELSDSSCAGGVCLGSKLPKSCNNNHVKRRTRAQLVGKTGRFDKLISSGFFFCRTG